MTPPPTAIGRLTGARWFARPWRRRATVLAVAAVLALLALFPERHRAAMTFTPADPASQAFAAGGAASVFGTQAATELALRVARSAEVRRIAAARLGLAPRFTDPAAADRWLAGNVDIRALRGGILQIEATERDPREALALVAAVGAATRERLAAITLGQSAEARAALGRLAAQAAARLASARADAVGAPATSLAARQDELDAARAFAAGNGAAVPAIRAEIDALRAGQRATGTEPAPGSDARRALIVASAVYDGYRRMIEDSSYDDLAALRGMRVIEPPYLDSARQIAMLPAALGLLVLLLGLAMEAYAARPPVGARR